MRLLLFVNLIAIVVLAGALAHTYEGAPLPWRLAAAPAIDASPEFSSAPAETPPHEMKEEPLRILTEGAYPPFNYRDAAGRLTGFDVDIAEALCARLKRNCTLDTRPWAALLPALADGKADAVVASMLIPSPGRQAPPADDRVAFTASYYSTPGRFAARKSGALAQASAASMAGKRVAVQKGSVHEAFLARRFPGVVAVPLPTLDEAEAALSEGRTDFLFADRNALLHWLKGARGADCCRLVGSDYSDPAFFGAGAGIAYRAEDPALGERLDEALAAMAADGTHAEISRRYFGQDIR